VDNGVAGLAALVENLGGNLSGVNQAFYNAVCGVDDDPEQGVCEGGANDGDACTDNEGCPRTCAGGANDGDACTVAADCPGGACEGECNLDNDDCLVEATPLDIELVVDANVEANCANVTVSSGGETNDIILNLSDPTEAGTVCASGTIGTIPITIAGQDGAFGNVVIRATVSEDGFTDGLLGATVDGDTAVLIAEALLEGAGAQVMLTLDINTDLSGNNSVDCDALSATFAVAGVALPPAQ
jgi:hypothetical protein